MMKPSPNLILRGPYNTFRSKDQEAHAIRYVPYQKYRDLYDFAGEDSKFLHKKCSFYGRPTNSGNHDDTQKIQV
jgi:hypothetical protein